MSVEAPIKQADYWFIGEDRDLLFRVTDGDGEAKDVTDWSLVWVLRERPGSDEVLLEKSTASETIGLENGPAGLVRVDLTRADTLALGAGEYFHTLARIDEGEWAVLSFGTAHLQQAAAR